jgi:peptide/nickel transport system substrate-binding protein
VTEVFYDVLYPSPDSMFFQQYDSKASGSWASMEWLDDPQVDALIAQSRLTVDTAKRNAIYKQIQARIVALQPDVFMFADLWRQAVRPSVTGFQWIPAGQYQFYDLKKTS